MPTGGRCGASAWLLGSSANFERVCTLLRTGWARIHDAANPWVLRGLHRPYTGLTSARPRLASVAMQRTHPARTRLVGP